MHRDLSQASKVEDSFKAKVVLVGDQGVGKSSIIFRLVNDSFDNQQPTVGIDFLKKTITVDGNKLSLQLWDTAGQEKYRSILSNYIKVFDCTSPESIANVKGWVDFILQRQSPTFFLVGNKKDLIAEQVDVTAPLGHLNLPICLVSAKSGDGLEQMFYEAAKQILPILSDRQNDQQPAVPSPAAPVRLQQGKNQTKGGRKVIQKRQRCCV